MGRRWLGGWPYVMSQAAAVLGVVPVIWYQEAVEVETRRDPNLRVVPTLRKPLASYSLCRVGICT
jgi:hypothetical protein